MTVRIFIGEHEDVKELAEEFPQEAAIIQEMLEAAEAEAEEQENETSSDA